MINPTGLIKTDLLILDIFGKSIIGRKFQKKMGKNIEYSWCSKTFLKIKKFF